MALIVIAVHDTEENKRTEYTRRTLESLLKTVDFKKHRLYISDNGSCADTLNLYSVLGNAWAVGGLRENLTIQYNGENLGTAKAVNKGLATRLKNEDGTTAEYCIKMDNDVVIHNPGWVDAMEDAINRMPDIGILGLKRKDLEQRPMHPNAAWRSQIEMLPHEHGQPWRIVEYAEDIMGTCTMYNPRLMDAIGGLRQPGQYGWDDTDYCKRSQMAGFRNAFLPCIEIEHIDVGGDPYCKWKTAHSGELGGVRQQWIKAYMDGSKPLMEVI